MYQGGEKGKTQPLLPHSLYKSANKSKEKTQEKRTEANRWKKAFCFLRNAQTLICVPGLFVSGCLNDGFIIMMMTIKNNDNTSTL